ncbi:AAA family ATPase [Dyella silvatica]|uniref:AAA family ATPase n=1 Tax=Dyella silvatica TaxID=2992128 RepID=UPI00224DC9E3|nr:AAA family ATPase [Dyella silvatica]
MPIHLGSLSIHIAQTSVFSVYRNSVILKENNWDDFGFKATFAVTIIDDQGASHELGDVKIGRAGLTGGWVSQALLPTLQVDATRIPDDCFSLGQDPEYYSKTVELLGVEGARSFLALMRDVAADASLFRQVANEKSLSTSLMRYVSLSVIEAQYRRILSGGVMLTEFDFVFKRDESPESAGIELSFKVDPLSQPPTNIHVLIGRNGVGKTTLLNAMIRASVKATDGAESTSTEHFFTRSAFQLFEIDDTYFSSVVSISFSAFDPFVPPRVASDRAKGPSYLYIGLKTDSGDTLKSLTDLRQELSRSVAICLGQSARKRRWLSAIQMLESDPNFEEMNLSELGSLEASHVQQAAWRAAEKMSSGHAIVLLSISRLVEAVEEKTLVIIDEPESHLHPPLLSAFIRALSELLTERNGVAIVASHSPVVLQEVPRSCVWKLWRMRRTTSVTRPEAETFGENVGVLTREVFGLEVAKSGFHALLELASKNAQTLDEAAGEFGNQIGLEGRLILRALMAEKDQSGAGTS